jgi:transcriptional regulator with XRE-family HTH domain
MAKLEFTRKKIGSLTLGEKLRKLRGEFRISLSEIAKATKIQAKYLEYLEAGEYAKLPADVYVRGFLRSYARYLNVDEEALMKLYERERHVQKNMGGTSEEGFSHKKAISIRSFTLTPRAAVLSLAALIVVGVFFYLYQEFYHFAADPRLVILEPAPGAKIEESETVLRGETDKGNQVTVNGEAVFVDASGHFEETLTLRPGVNTVSVRTVNRFEKEKLATLQIEGAFSQEAPEDSGALRQAIENQPKIILDLRVEKASRVSITVDGKEIESGLLPEGATKHLEGTEKITLSSDHGEWVFVKRPDEEEHPLGTVPGPVKDVEFLPQTGAPDSGAEASAPPSGEARSDGQKPVQ